MYVTINNYYLTYKIEIMINSGIYCYTKNVHLLEICISWAKKWLYLLSD